MTRQKSNARRTGLGRSWRGVSVGNGRGGFLLARESHSAGKRQKGADWCLGSPELLPGGLAAVTAVAAGRRKSKRGQDESLDL